MIVFPFDNTTGYSVQKLLRHFLIGVVIGRLKNVLSSALKFRS